MATEQQMKQFIDEIIEEVEEILEEKKSWYNLMTRLLYIFLGVFVLVGGAFTCVTMTDWIAFGVFSSVLELAGVGFICWDAYMRVQMERFLAEMQSIALEFESAGDLESAGE